MMRPFALFCAAVLAGSALLEVRGASLLPQGHHVTAPAPARGAAGYRVFRGWGGGFHGGK